MAKSKLNSLQVGLPWWCSGWESACQCGGHGFEPWSGRIPCAAEQVGPWATIAEPARLEPVFRNERGRDGEGPARHDEEWPPLAATREKPSHRGEDPTQPKKKTKQKKNNNKKIHCKFFCAPLCQRELFFFNFIYLFIYLWLCWVFTSVRGLSLVAASGGHSSSRCAGLSLLQPLLLWSTGSRCAGSVVVAHGPSRSAACGIFPDHGSNPCPLHWQADSQPLRHQGELLT